MKSIIKEEGILFLSVPVGIDKLVWNLHRIYGELRLPKLLLGWEILNIYTHSYCEPVFVLQNSYPKRDKLEGIVEAVV